MSAGSDSETVRYETGIEEAEEWNEYISWYVRCCVWFGYGRLEIEV
jgi:hypothetical protein